MSETLSPPSLDREALTDVVDLALTAGQLLMENGAESVRVEHTVRAIGTGLGCDWGDVLVSHNAILVTHSSGGEFRTKVRRITQGGVNMSLVAEVSHLTHLVERQSLGRTEVRSALHDIRVQPRKYGRGTTLLMVALACAAFSRILGGDWPAFAITFVAAGVAMFVRQTLAAAGFNAFLVTLVTALTAGLLVGGANLLRPQSVFATAMAASVLLLVPGVPFINAVEDLIKGYTVVGLARGAMAGLVIFAIALGLLLAIHLTGTVGR